jgi:VWFA-related protein
VARRLTFLLALALAGTGHATAQSAGGDQPVFRSGVDLVRFDLRVVDESGRPVTDLRPEEIEISEDGKPLPVVLFQRITEPAGTYVDAALRAVTAEVSSNDGSPRGHLYILIFDQQHITPGNEQRARLAAEQFVRRRVRPSDRVALFAVPGPGPQLAFTTDKMRVLDELSKIRGSYQRAVSTPLGTMSIFEAHLIARGDEKVTIDALERINRESGADIVPVRGAAGTAAAGAAGAEDSTVTRRLLQENARTLIAQSDAESRQFLQRLADVVAGFSGVEGRKTVVFFSEGFFQDNLSRELEVVAAAAAQSYAVFYTVDLNQRVPTLTETGAATITLASEIQERIAPMSTLAVETDGAMIVDATSRLEQTLDTLADQAMDYYLVAFTPSEAARAERGKYRRVQVKVTREGARASARTGYVLPPENKPVDRRKAIDTALTSPFVQQGLKVDYTTYVMKAAEAAGRHRVVLSLTTDLPLQSAPDESADVVFVVRDLRDGRVAASGSDRISLPKARHAGRAAGSGAWRVGFDLPAGAYLMRAVVREPGGLVGSADRRIDVRPLDGPDVTVSDLIVGSSLAGLPVRPRAYTGDGLSGVIEAYARSSVQLEKLEVKIELRRQADATPVASFDAELARAEEDETGVNRRARFQLPLTGVQPGDYVAHAIVTARSETVAERTRLIEVLPGSAPVAAPDVATRPEIVSPAEIVRGDLARKYVALLRQRAQGTPSLEAARRASEGRWEHVEVELGRLADTGLVVQGLRGLALFAREDYAAAAAALKLALAAEPANTLTAFFLGWALEGAGDTRSAIGAWRNAAHLDPSMIPAHLALADAYLRLSQPALAAQALKAGLSAQPESPELLAKLGEIERIKEW